MRNVRLSRTLLRNYGDPGSPCYLLLEIAPAKPSALSPEPREFSFLGPRCSRNLGSGWLTLCPSLDYGCLTTKSTKVCQRRRECLISSRGKLVVTLPWIDRRIVFFGLRHSWHVNLNFSSRSSTLGDGEWALLIEVQGKYLCVVHMYRVRQ